MGKFQVLKDLLKMFEGTDSLFTLSCAEPNVNDLILCSMFKLVCIRYKKRSTSRSEFTRIKELILVICPFYVLF